MSTDRPVRNKQVPRRFDDVGSTRSASVPLRAMVLPSNEQQRPSSSTSSRSNSNSTSILSSARNLSTPVTTTSDPRAAVSSNSYRMACERNNIIVKPLRTEVPQSVKDFRYNIINQKRTSPAPSQQYFQETMKVVCDLEDEDEGSIRAGFLTQGLLPQPGVGRYENQISANFDALYDSTTVPRVPQAPRLVTPKPNVHYCLHRKAFTVEEDITIESLSLDRCAAPSSSGKWPYFNVEFKSQSRGGTFWVAENQNAISSALCVNNMQRLLGTVNKTRTEIDSVSFSCNIDANHAGLWIHYCKDGNFAGFELQTYQFKTENDIVYFRNSIKNVTDFGFQRLTQVKSLLAEIALVHH